MSARSDFIIRRARQISPVSWETYGARRIMSRNEEICWINSLEQAEDEWLAEHKPREE